MAMLPGQVGKDRDHCPEELYGRERENERLLKAAELLGPSKRQLLRYPGLLWSQFQLLAMEIYRRINARTEHDLEGWEKSGHVANEWRLDPSLPWMPTDQIPRPARITATIDPPAHPGQSPNSAASVAFRPAGSFHRLCNPLAKGPQLPFPDLLGPNFGVLRTVRDAVIEITDQEIDPDPMLFNAW
jgi:hypothetical protein